MYFPREEGQVGGGGVLRKREALPAFPDILIIHRETRVRSVQLNSEGSSELWLWCQLQRREGYPGAVPSAPLLLFKQGSDQWAHSGSNGWGRCLSAMWMLLRDPIALVCLHRWSTSLKACLASIITVSNGSWLCSDVTHSGDITAERAVVGIYRGGVTVHLSPSGRHVRAQTCAQARTS